MRVPRIHQPGRLVPGETLQLDARATRHVVRVLRLRAGDALILFNGEGGEYRATLSAPARDGARVEVGAFVDRDPESPLRITLAQGISRGERMDFTLQKSVELGVAAIQPLFAERTQVRLAGERLDKRLGHWQGVVTAACEQSGRTRLPAVLPPRALDDWLAARGFGTGVLLDHRAGRGLTGIVATDALTLLIGPEGGLTEDERDYAYSQGFTGVRMGPRVLRTETAAVAALAALQARYGDWSRTD